jgi:hypothetical protein
LKIFAKTRLATETALSRIVQRLCCFFLKGGFLSGSLIFDFALAL